MPSCWPEALRRDGIQTPYHLKFWELLLFFKSNILYSVLSKLQNKNGVQCFMYFLQISVPKNKYTCHVIDIVLNANTSKQWNTEESQY